MTVPADLSALGGELLRRSPPFQTEQNPDGAPGRSLHCLSRRSSRRNHRRRLDVVVAVLDNPYLPGLRSHSQALGTAQPAAGHCLARTYLGEADAGIALCQDAAAHPYHDSCQDEDRCTVCSRLGAEVSRCAFPSAAPSQAWSYSGQEVRSCSPDSRLEGRNRGPVADHVFGLGSLVVGTDVVLDRGRPLEFARYIRLPEAAALAREAVPYRSVLDEASGRLRQPARPSEVINLAPSRASVARPGSWDRRRRRRRQHRCRLGSLDLSEAFDSLRKDGELARMQLRLMINCVSTHPSDPSSRAVR